ncbi:MAG: glycosyltransferase family 1 protein [Lachnospiraceae bacterium]|nr:glycosyltransferase family 1 protein [Lachnospiraceae bacterium]
MIDGKRIAIDARMIECSGIGTYIQHLLGHGIYDVAVGNESLIRKYDKKIDVITFESSIYGPKGQFFFPVKRLKKAGIKLIHFPHYSVPFFCNIPFVVTVHDLIHFIYPEFLRGRIKFLYAKFLMKHALEKSKHIFTVSEYSKKDIINYFGTNGNKITVIYNAVDDDFRVKKTEEYDYLYEKYHISHRKRVLLYVGNMKSHKNLATLLEAYTMTKTRDKLILILAGKAFKGEKVIEKMEKELDIRDSVIHTGVIDKGELVDIYNLADVFVFPSLYEGFGLPPLEAMACGTPVICSNTSSLPEVVGNAAVLVDPKQPRDIAMEIDRLLFDDVKTTLLSKLGIKKAKEYSWDENIRVLSESILKFVFDGMSDK